MEHIAKLAKKEEPMTPLHRRLPDELWEKMLLNHDARTEAAFKMICPGLNRLVKQPHYRSEREKMVDEKEYCPVILPIDVGDNNPLGWDLAEKKWRKLPPLNFLLEPKDMKLRYNNCHNGLLFLTYKSTNNFGFEYLRHYVCNPLTRTYISIDLSALEERCDEIMVACQYSILINAEESGSGFTLFAATSSSTLGSLNMRGYLNIRAVQKLESNNLDGGWLPLKDPPADLREALVIAGPVWLDMVIYSLCRMSSERGAPSINIWLVSCHVGTGEWTRTLVMTMSWYLYGSSSLLIVGGQMWLSMIVATSVHPVDPFASLKEKLSCVLSRYEPETQKFITITTVPLLDDIVSARRPQGALRGNYKSAICCLTSHETLRVFDVLTGKWSECPRPNLEASWVGGGGFQILQGCLQMKHAPAVLPLMRLYEFSMCSRGSGQSAPGQILTHFGSEGVASKFSNAVSK